MPEELKIQPNFSNAIMKYKHEVGTETYQPLSTLLNKINNLCKSSISQIVTSQSQELIKME